MENPQYIQKKQLDEVSYIWDRIIEKFHADFKQGVLLHNPSRSELEKMFRTMAKENRFCRRMLSQHFKDIVDTKVNNKQVIARALKPEIKHPVLYVYLVGNYQRREHRQAELSNRCFVARYLNKDCRVVIGLATEPYVPNGGYSFDCFYLELPEWTDEHEKNAIEIQNRFGYFKKPMVSRIGSEEYPMND
jgi:hypothetical protein